MNENFLKTLSIIPSGVILVNDCNLQKSEITFSNKEAKLLLSKSE
jgi:hypothetical protein